MPIYMKIEGVRGIIESAETDTLVFTDGGTEPGPAPAPVISYWPSRHGDDAELDFAAADSSEAGETATVTLTVNVNNYLPAVQHDYDLS